MARPATIGRLHAFPGFTDHHVHLLSAAARRLSVDVSQPAVAGIPALIGALRSAASERPPGAWIRAWGYDEALLRERRHPTRSDLDLASGAHPIVLRHRNGQLAVVNSAALVALGRPAAGDGIAAVDLLPPVPRIDPGQLGEAVDAVSSRLASAGVTAVTDATVGNGVAELELFAELVAAGRIRQRLTAMVGLAELEAAAAAGLRFGGRLAGVTIGHAKAYVSEDSDAAELREGIAAAAHLGWPVALHVVGLVELDIALGALEAVPPPPGCRHRVEHLSLSLADQVARLARLPVTVVTNPGFIPARGERYRRELGTAEQSWLYRCASLLAAGIEVRGGSDLPVTESEPLDAIAAANDRLCGGEPIGAAEGVDVGAAFGLFGGGEAARAAGDLVLLSENPLEDSTAIRRSEVAAASIGGKLVYAAGDTAAEHLKELLRRRRR